MFTCHSVDTRGDRSARRSLRQLRRRSPRVYTAYQTIRGARWYRNQAVYAVSVISLINYYWLILFTRQINRQKTIKWWKWWSYKEIHVELTRRLIRDRLSVTIMTFQPITEQSQEHRKVDWSRSLRNHVFQYPRVWLSTCTQHVLTAVANKADRTAYDVYTV